MVIDLMNATRTSLRGTADFASEAELDDLIGARKNFRGSVPMFTSGQWARLRGVSSSPSVLLAKYREQGRLFSVQVGRNHLYPQFQFDHHAAPRDAVAEVLSAVPRDAQGWALLSWFDAASPLLEGRKPRDVLSKDPEAVVRAARDFYGDE
jgi:hypothetical protein